MDRKAEARALAEELLADIEFARIETQNAVLRAYRLARLTDDEDALVWLGFELHGYPSDGSYADLLARMGRKSRDESKYYFVPLAHIAQLHAVYQTKLSALHTPNISSEYALPTIREHHGQLNKAAGDTAEIGRVTATVMASVHEFATNAYLELTFSEIQADLFATARDVVDSRLTTASSDALAKIESINERLRAGDAEAISHAMTTCRRLIKGVADAVFPASDEPLDVGDTQMSVTDDKVLNRLNAHMIECGISNSRRERLRRTIGDLYGRVSAGVHADVTAEEARFIFLHTYTSLGEILSMSKLEPTAAKVPDLTETVSSPVVGQ